MEDLIHFKSTELHGTTAIKAEAVIFFSCGDANSFAPSLNIFIPHFMNILNLVVFTFVARISACNKNGGRWLHGAPMFSNGWEYCFLG